MGKHSGRAAFRSKLEDLGLHLSDNQFQDAFDRIKALADRKKNVYDEDIERWSTRTSPRPPTASGWSPCR